MSGTNKQTKEVQDFIKLDNSALEEKEVPQILRDKFPDHNIKQATLGNRSVWKVQSKCGSACDDRGRYYDDEGNFIKANSWKVVNPVI